MTAIVPNAAAVGIPVADQLDRAHEIARWVEQTLWPADAALLLVDPVTHESLIPTANRVYIAALDGASGVGTLADPIRVGAGANLDTAALRTAILDAIDNRTGDVAIYLDNTIDTSLATAPMAGFVTGAGADRLHVLAWDRVGNDPHRVPVLDGFRPVAEFVTGYSGWTDAGSGVYTVTLDAMANLPQMLRLGPATQHIHGSGAALADDPGLVYSSSLANINGSAQGEHRFHLDTSTRVLSVRLADGSDPGSADVRASVQDEGFRFTGTRVYIDGLRVSGYDAAGTGNAGYCVSFTAAADALFWARRVRCDLALRHVMGMAFGSGGGRFSHARCEFGTGINFANAGYTPSVAYSENGGSSEIGIDALFVDGTIDRRTAQATILHRGSSGTVGSAIYVRPVLVSPPTGGAFERLINHGDRDADAYSLCIGTNHIQRAAAAGNVRPGAHNTPSAYADTTLDFVLRGDQASAGIQFVDSSRTRFEQSALRIGGTFSGNASNAFAALNSRGGANDWINSRASYTLRASVLDLSTWERSGVTGFFRSSQSVYDAAHSQPVEPMLDLVGCMVRAPDPASSSFRWFSAITTPVNINASSIANLVNVSDCAFVGTFPANQTPTGATAYTEGQWADLDPTTLSPALATAWLIDRRDLLPAVRAAIAARRIGDTVHVFADPDGSDTGCVVAVSVTDSATPTDADLVAGILGTVDSDDTDAVVLTGTGHAFVFAYDPEDGFVRAAQNLGTITSIEPAGGAVLDAESGLPAPPFGPFPMTIHPAAPRIVRVTRTGFGLAVDCNIPVADGGGGLDGWTMTGVHAFIAAIDPDNPTHPRRIVLAALDGNGDPILPPDDEPLNYTQPGAGVVSAADPDLELNTTLNIPTRAARAGAARTQGAAAMTARTSGVRQTAAYTADTDGVLADRLYTDHELAEALGVDQLTRYPLLVTLGPTAAPGDLRTRVRIQLALAGAEPEDGFAAQLHVARRVSGEGGERPDAWDVRTLAEIDAEAGDVELTLRLRTTMADAPSEAHAAAGRLAVEAQATLTDYGQAVLDKLGLEQLVTVIPGDALAPTPRPAEIELADTDRAAAIILTGTAGLAMLIETTT